MIKTPRAPYVILSAALTSSLAWSQGCTVRYYFYSAESGTASGSGGMGGTDGGGLCSAGETRSCYDGPEGSEGKGICKAGFETCAADGMSWGACEGAVKPFAENCATPEDEDCDGKAPSCDGELLWARSFGEDGNQYPSGLAVDTQGNVIVAGNFTGTINVDGDILTSVGETDVFVLKLDTNGNSIWSIQLGGTGYDGCAGVAVDAAGDVVIVGNFAATVDFGGGPLTSSGPGDIFVAKLSSTGAHLWSHRFGALAGQNPSGIAVDDAGRVALAGTFYGAIEFGGPTLTSAGAGDIFVAMLDADGDHLWSTSIGDAANQTTYGIAFNKAGNVLVTGSFEGSMMTGSNALTSQDEADAFIFALDGSGAPIWSRSFGSAGVQAGYAIAADGLNDVAVSGYLDGAVDFGKGLVQGGGGTDFFLVKLDASAETSWSYGFGDQAYQISYSVAFDPLGNVLLTGGFDGILTFGSNPYASAGLQDVFIAKFDALGHHLWSRRAGDSDSDIGSVIRSDGASNVFVAGTFSGSIDFGGGPLSSKGEDDMFIAKFGP